jgi:hypothetical protein
MAISFEGKSVMMRCFSLILLPIGLLCCVSARAELVAWWPFDDGHGTIARDSSKNVLTGTLFAQPDAPGLPQWTSDRNNNAGKALLFNTPFSSARNYVYTPYIAKLDLANTWTITAWIKINDHSNGMYGAVIFTDNYCLQIGAVGDTQMWWWPTNAGSWQFGMGAGTEPALNQWHHVAVTYDGTTFRYYKDGVSSFTKTGLPAMPSNVWNYLYIGYYPYSSRFFVGAMDDVAIWNETLSQAQIQDIKNNGIKVYHATNPQPLDAMTNVNTSQVLSWTAGINAIAHNVYFGTNKAAVTAATNPNILPGRGQQAGTTYDPGALPESTTYYWRVDEISAGRTEAGVVWSFTTGSSLASSPSPANGAADVSIDTALTWQAGIGATSHRVYLSTDSQAVINGTAPYVTVTNPAYTPASPLTLGATYYWRVTEINAGGTAIGPVWSFTTSYKIIEPFGYATNSALRAAWVGSPNNTLNITAPTGSGWMWMPYSASTQTYTRTFSQDLDLSIGTRLFMKYYHGPNNLFDPPTVRLKLLNVSDQVLFQADLADTRVGLEGMWQVNLSTGSALNTVRKIVLEVPAYSDTGYFDVDDIMLGSTMCGVHSAGDLSGDCVVDFKDMVELSSFWLNSGF